MNWHSWAIGWGFSLSAGQVFLLNLSLFGMYTELVIHTPPIQMIDFEMHNWIFVQPQFRERKWLSVDCKWSGVFSD